MKHRLENISLSPFTMWRSKWPTHLGGTVSKNNPLPKARFDGVSIRDKDTGLIYEVAVVRDRGTVRVVGLTILAGQETDRLQDIKTLPTQRLAEQAALYLAEQDASDGVPHFMSQAHKSKHDLPTFEQIADDYLSLGGRAPLVRKYVETGVMSKGALDERIRKARDADMIPEADDKGRGRPRKNATPDSGSNTSGRKSGDQ